MEEVVEFERIVQCGCGLDVHKEIVVATIDGAGLKKETRVYGTTTSSLTKLEEWLMQSKITHVAMESTGVYWKPVFNVLEPSGITVWVVSSLKKRKKPSLKLVSTDKRPRKMP